MYDDQRNIAMSFYSDKGRFPRYLDFPDGRKNCMDWINRLYGTPQAAYQAYVGWFNTRKGRMPNFMKLNFDSPCEEGSRYELADYIQKLGITPGKASTPQIPPEIVPTPSAYKMYMLDRRLGGDVLLNPEIKNNIPTTDFSDQIFDNCKLGSVVVELGNGQGKKVLIAAGIHGNEEEANIAAMRYLEEIRNTNINGMIYVIPFVIPKDTAINSRMYGTTDPNRTSHFNGTPGNVVANFAKSRGVKYVVDVHSGADVSTTGHIFYRHFDEPNWFKYIKSKTNCTGRYIAGFKGSLRQQLNTAGINCVTLEVERDDVPTSQAAVVDYNMLKAGVQYMGFP